MTYSGCGVGPDPMPAVVARLSTRSRWRCSVTDLSSSFHWTMPAVSVCLPLVCLVGHQSSHWSVGTLCSLSVTLVTWGCDDVVQAVTAGDDEGMVIFCCANEQERRPLT